MTSSDNQRSVQRPHAKETPDAPDAAESEGLILALEAALERLQAAIDRIETFHASQGPQTRERHSAERAALVALRDEATDEVRRLITLLEVLVPPE